MAREFFRIVRGSEPMLADFMSIVTAPGRRLRFPKYRREFEEGVPNYDDFAHTCEMAREHRFRHGLYVVKLIVPDDGSVEFKQTFAEHHYTIYAGPERILAMVEGSPVRIPETGGD